MLQWNLWAGWIGILLGMASGAALGLFFHEDGWLGGYASWPRRMLRLGHISFFGIGFLNLSFAATLYVTQTNGAHQSSSILLIAAAVLMPATCFLAAWRKPLRHLFPIPALSLLAAAVLAIGGLIP
jgi:hypothetical protein